MATSLIADIEELSELYLFRSVSPQALRAFCRKAAVASFEAGEVVLRQGDPADMAVMVVRGRLLTVVGDPGHERMIGEARPGELVGETALFVSGGRRSATVRAAEPARCLIINRALLQQFPNNPAMIAIEGHLLGSLARRIRTTNLNIQRVWKEEVERPEPAPAPENTLRARLRRLFGGER
jgi:CRP-like cAMP-binding protein